MDKRISLHKLDIFVRVIETGSVSRTAEHFFVSQPVITSHLRALEQQVGAKLLLRHDGRMAPTLEGARVHEWALVTLTKARELERELSEQLQGTRGSAAIAASMSFGSYALPRLLPPFLKDRPDARVSVHISSPESAMAAVAAGECDFAVVVGEQNVTIEGVTRRELYDEEVVLVGAPESARWAELQISDLASVPFVCSPTGSQRRLINDRLMAEHGIPDRRVIVEFEHPEAIKRIVASRIAIALLLRSSVRDELRSGQLVELIVPGLDAMRTPVSLLFRTEKSFSALQSQLIDYISTAVKEL